MHFHKINCILISLLFLDNKIKKAPPMNKFVENFNFKFFHAMNNTKFLSFVNIFS